MAAMGWLEFYYMVDVWGLLVDKIYSQLSLMVKLLMGICFIGENGIF